MHGWTVDLFYIRTAEYLDQPAEEITLRGLKAQLIESMKTNRDNRCVGCNFHRIFFFAKMLHGLGILHNRGNSVQTLSLRTRRHISLPSVVFLSNDIIVRWFFFLPHSRSWRLRVQLHQNHIGGIFPPMELDPWHFFMHLSRIALMEYFTSDHIFFLVISFHCPLLFWISVYLEWGLS